MNRTDSKALLICAISFLIALPVFASEVSGTLCTGVNCPVEGTVMGAPTMSPLAGTYHEAQNVTLTSAGSSGMCYTTDGTTPACATATTCLTGTLYSTSSPISITSTKTIQALSCYPNSNTSSVASSTYTLTCSVASVTNGTVSDYSACAITCNSGYTLSGSSCVASASTGGGGGGPSGDVAAPSISDIAVATLGDSYAVISWKTNESSLSWINYGTSTSYGLTSKTLAYASSHSLTLTNLSASTVYHYQVKSQDTAGNVGSYTDKTFTTLSAGAAPVVTTIVTTPVITSVASALYTAQVKLLNALIVQLQSLLQQAQAAGVQLPAGTEQYLSMAPVMPGGASQFTRSLTVGSQGEDVRDLQKFLNTKGFLVASEGSGSLGNETTFFGSLTKNALAKYQASVGISPASGYFGSLTREYINMH